MKNCTYPELADWSTILCMRVFVSSTYDDLVEHRRAVDDALVRLNLQSGRMEVFGAGPRAPVEKCLEEVANSDLFVGIYAHRYGFVPVDNRVSITELEYREALRGLCKTLLEKVKSDCGAER
jgi:hypothetical protein